MAFAVRLLAGHHEEEKALQAEAGRVPAGGTVAFEHLPQLEVTGRMTTETLRLYPPG